MNNLQQFLMDNPVDNLTEELIVSTRLKDYPFTIKAMTGSEYNDYQARCIENPNSPKKRKFNTKRFNELIVVNHTITPNFKDAEWVKAAECGMDSTRLMYKMLLPGEISELAEAILRLSGFETDLEEEIEEIKN